MRLGTHASGVLAGLSSAMPPESESCKSLIHTGLQPGDLWQEEIRETVFNGFRFASIIIQLASALRETVKTVSLP